MRTIRTLLAVALVFCFVSEGSAAGKIERATLAGVRSMQVIVEDVDNGFSKTYLQTNVELMLRQNKIRVADEGTLPYLYVQVSSLDAGDGRIVYNTSVEFRQIVTLKSGKKAFGTTTWRTGGIGVVGKSRISTVYPGIGRFINEFINDYLAANPR